MCRELVRAEFGDERLTRRLMRIVEAWSGQPTAGIPDLGAKEAKAAYRFFDNLRVGAEGILQPHRQRTVERAAPLAEVLVAQDTTEINLTDHPAAEGLGHLGNPRNRGLLLHTLLCLSPEGVPLGVLDQFAWARPTEELGKRHTRHQRCVTEKESQKWLDGLAAVGRHFPASQRVILIGDRESDLYDLFAAPRPAHVELLVRARHLRRLVEHPDKDVQGALAAAPEQAQVPVEVPRCDERPPRTAVLTLRWHTLVIRRPQNYRGPAERRSLPLSFLEAREEHPPPGAKALRWVLATTLPLTTLEEALRVLAFYRHRWLCERFHYVLKSGCRIEQHQLREAQRITNLIATLSVVAWRIMWLTYEARRQPETPCTVVLTADEWQVLQRVTEPRRPLPPQPFTLRQALRAIAKLGGFFGRKRDGEPGLKTVWKGYRRLTDLARGYQLAKRTDNITLAQLLSHEDYG